MLKLSFKFIFSVFFVVSGIFSLSVVSAQETAEPEGGFYIRLGEAKGKKSRIAFPALLFTSSTTANPKFQSIGLELNQVIFNDLNVSTFFDFIPPSAFLEDPAKTGLRPAPGEPNGFKFEAWKQISAEFLIRGAFSMAGNDLELEIFAYHVPKAQLVLSKKYKGPQGAVRRIAHTFTNEFLEILTGKAGPFLSKIVVATDRSGGQHREIFVMDWDGANPDRITNHRSICLSPAWSPDGKKVAYTAFVKRAKTKTRNADMFIYELATSKRWLVSYREGMNSGASFFPVGDDLLLTLSQGGSPDIYRMGVDGSLKSKVTFGPRGAMNVEPSISPDGNKVAFSSDRSGQPMIWIMNINGTESKRVTFQGKFNATPAWSPDGSKIAFSGWTDTSFDVFIMNSDGTGEIQKLTSSRKSNGRPANSEDPVFSPDGRLIMFTSNRTGKNQLYVTNLDGTEERRITTDSFNYYKPKWNKNLD